MISLQIIKYENLTKSTAQKKISLHLFTYAEGILKGKLHFLFSGNRPFRD